MSSSDRAQAASIQLIVNGEPRSAPRDCTVAELLQLLGITGRLAVEINEEILPRGQYESHRLRNGDRIEIVHAIGGG